ncbi:MAG TPA: hypothetical protein VLF94_05560 [Chlamydiales bacterium]|nr:hypothetical protein [Chlamydiales bacterium]
MEIDTATLEGALKVLGQILAERGLHYEVVAIGGGSLLLLGLIERTTKDLDLVALVKGKELISAIPLPQPLVQAAEQVGKALELGKEWLNIGPASLLEMGLPAGFMKRAHIRKYKGLTLYLADRFDQICFKLYASVDQGPESKHFADLTALKPSFEELQQAKKWCITHDVSVTFEKDVNQAIKSVYAE